jgi:hypothetical protein
VKSFLAVPGRILLKFKVSRRSRAKPYKKLSGPACRAAGLPAGRGQVDAKSGQRIDRGRPMDYDALVADS